MPSPDDREHLQCIKCRTDFYVLRRERDRKVFCPRCGWDGGFDYL